MSNTAEYDNARRLMANLTAAERREVVMIMNLRAMQQPKNAAERIFKNHWFLGTYWLIGFTVSWFNPMLSATLMAGYLYLIYKY